MHQPFGGYSQQFVGNHPQTGFLISSSTSGTFAENWTESGNYSTEPSNLDFLDDDEDDVEFEFQNNHQFANRAEIQKKIAEHKLSVNNSEQESIHTSPKQEGIQESFQQEHPNPLDASK